MVKGNEGKADSSRASGVWRTLALGLEGFRLRSLAFISGLLRVFELEHSGFVVSQAHVGLLALCLVVHNESLRRCCGHWTATPPAILVPRHREIP